MGPKRSSVRRPGQVTRLLGTKSEELHSMHNVFRGSIANTSSREILHFKQSILWFDVITSFVTQQRLIDLDEHHKPAPYPNNARLFIIRSADASALPGVAIRARPGSALFAHAAR